MKKKEMRGDKFDSAATNSQTDVEQSFHAGRGQRVKPLLLVHKQTKRHDKPRNAKGHACKKTTSLCKL